MFCSFFSLFVKEIKINKERKGKQNKTKYIFSMFCLFLPVLLHFVLLLVFLSTLTNHFSELVWALFSFVILTIFFEQNSLLFFSLFLFLSSYRGNFILWFPAIFPLYLCVPLWFQTLKVFLTVLLPKIKEEKKNNNVSMVEKDVLKPKVKDYFHET